MKTESTKIMVVEPYPPLAKVMIASINKAVDLEVIAQAHNETETLKLLENIHNQINVILLPTYLPKSKPYILKHYESVRIKYPNLKIIIHSMYRVGIHIHQIVISNIQGYVFTHCRSKELVKAIREVNKGGSYLGKEVKAYYEDFKRYMKVKEDFKPFVTAFEKMILEFRALGKSLTEISILEDWPEEKLQIHWDNVIRKFGTDQPALILQTIKDQQEGL